MHKIRHSMEISMGKKMKPALEVIPQPKSRRWPCLRSLLLQHISPYNFVASTRRASCAISN